MKHTLKLVKRLLDGSVSTLELINCISNAPKGTNTTSVEIHFS